MGGSRVRSTSLVLLAACGALSGCEDGLLYRAAPPGPASLSLQPAVQGGAAEAYEHIDRVFVRLRAGTETRVEEELPFATAGAETRVRLEVPLRDLTETLTLELELRMAQQPLFRASLEVTLQVGRTSNIEVPSLEPVIASVVCAGPQLELASYGQTAQLPAVALFASNDTVRNAALQWSTPQTTIVSVDANTGVVTALQDGTAQVVCAAGGLTDVRPVRVFAVVSTITVGPPSATVAVGASQQFSATLRDARTNAIAGRTVTWTSSSGAANVTQAGLATGLAPGTSRIDASSGGATGSASLTVLTPPPVVVTSPATSVGATSAVLNGTVNPRGFATSAWFEWGTDPSLATFATTLASGAGSGSVPGAASAAVGNLQANATYYYRQAASNAGGTARGSIVSFSTSAPPLVATTGVSGVTETGATFHGSVDPQGAAATAWFEYGNDPTLGTFATTPQQNVGTGRAAGAISASVANLSPGTDYYFRAAAASSGGTTRGQILKLSTLVPPPLVATSGASTIRHTSAVLNGTINPRGYATTAWFDYSTSATLAGAVRVAQQAAGNGSSTIGLIHNLNFLTAGTTYHYRIGASNGGGVVLGNVVSFTTLAPAAPAARMISAQWNTPTTPFEIIMSGGITTNGLVTEAWFEWSEFADFRTFTASGRASIAARDTEVVINGRYTMGSCSPWYVRAGAQNSLGVRYSAVVGMGQSPPCIIR